MGARPVAVMDPLRFGAADHPDTRRVAATAWSPASVATATAWACPTSAARSCSTPSYQGNPLVNALCVGVMRHEDIHLASARGVGNRSSSTAPGPAATASAGCRCWPRETFAEGGPTKRPACRSGDPFMEKLLIECTLEVLGAGLVEGIQDLGGAGISCATSELASQR